MLHLKTLAAFSMQGLDPWIEVDGGVTPENAWKVSHNKGLCECRQPEYQTVAGMCFASIQNKLHTLVNFDAASLCFS